MTETSEDPTLALLDMLDDVEQENAETSREQEQQVTQIPLSPEEEGATGEPLLLPATTPPVNLKPILAKENQHIAKRKQLKSALAHFNNFLKQYWALETSTRDLSTIPNHDRLYDFLQDGDLNPELLGSFCTYLSAADSPTSRDGHLSASTCGNYLSTISSYYIDRQYLPNWYYYEKEGDELSPAKLSACFGKESDYYSKSTKALKKKISDRSKENGIPMVVPKAGASEEDWIIIAMSCVLQGRTHPHLPEFWAFSVALTHFAARGKLSQSCKTPTLLYHPNPAFDSTQETNVPSSSISRGPQLKCPVLITKRMLLVSLRSIILNKLVPLKRCMYSRISLAGIVISTLPWHTPLPCKTRSPTSYFPDSTRRPPRQPKKGTTIRLEYQMCGKGSWTW